MSVSHYAMPGTFSQLYIHLVFAVKGRQNLIRNEWKDDLYKYISGIIKAKKHKSIIINGMPDHVHIFLGLSPSTNISDLVREIKTNTTRFINSKNYLTSKFCWQEGYGAFSYSQSHIGNLYNYIFNQEHHHRHRSFKQEYIGFLEKFEINYDSRFLFDWID
jgi:REP element-mobilizing transposase RayT